MTDFETSRIMMVDTQVRPSDVVKFPVIDAMLSVRREAFVPASKRDVAYMGKNIDLDGGRVMLDPRTLGKMLDALDVQQGELVLNVGAALGYSTAVLASMAEAVIAVEQNADWVRDAEIALADQGADNAVVIEGTLHEGAAKHGPYDVIMVEGAVEHIPQNLTGQLKEGGRIAAIFVDGALGECRIGYKIDGHMNWRMAFNASAPVLKGFEKQRDFVL